jgi:hypothetical protein
MTWRVAADRSRSRSGRVGGWLTTPGDLRVPEIAALLWVLKGLSTALGEATSDYLVHTMALTKVDTQTAPIVETEAPKARWDPATSRNVVGTVRVSPGSVRCWSCPAIAELTYHPGPAGLVSRASFDTPSPKVTVSVPRVASSPLWAGLPTAETPTVRLATGRDRQC